MEDGDCDEKEEPSDDDEVDEAPPGVSVSAADVDVPDDDVEMMGSPPRQDKAPPSPSALFCAGALDGLQFLGCSADHAEDLAARAPIVGGGAEPPAPAPEKSRAAPRLRRKTPETAGVPKIYNGAVYAGATMEQMPYLRVTPRPAAGCCGGGARSYDVHGGEDADSKLRKLFTAEEESKLCTRCFCRPFHSRSVLLKHAGSHEVLVTIERPGVECCCDRGSLGAKPCLCGPNWADACSDGVVVHEGRPAGAPGFLPLDRVVGVVHEPQSCGCVPRFEALDENYDVVGYVEGRPCFGGFWDACLDSSFAFSKAPGRAGDKGHITHVKSLCGDDELIELELNMMAGKDKLLSLASVILLDGAFFERDNRLCRFRKRRGACQATCCLCYAGGCYCPLAVSLGPGGAPPAADAREPAAVAPRAMDRS